MISIKDKATETHLATINDLQFYCLLLLKHTSKSRNIIKQATNFQISLVCYKVTVM